MPTPKPSEVARSVKETVESAIEKTVEKAQELVDPQAPGVPAPETPSLEEPTTPREPLPPKPDQGTPTPLTPTGEHLDADPTDFAQRGAHLTTAGGVRLPDTDHSLKVGPRGPTVLHDHHLREKVSHFDHERIPERVVHARGAAAHGTFVGYGTATPVCHAGVFAEGKQTPVFTRFSTVLGSRGSADTVRDTRGFAVKFYTDEGNWDLVGNNIPVFFIQDGIKFPDIIHAGKPHPDREIPQAQSAHDTFWDFVSLHTEAQHHTLWNMSDRGIPRSFRMMEGFGVHTWRVTNADGQTHLVKFHWKPVLGVHSLVWEEAQMLNGIDPDFHRRDLADAIESGAHPQWELGIQVFEDNPDQTFEGIDLLDPTKLVPEELAEVQPIGRLTLDRNPTNYFAETEQVAFCTSHLVPGIDVTDDPLLAARNFSYLDTQITRLGGPNWQQLPINRAHVPVNDMLRDGYGQQAVHGGVAPYKPNALDGGCPFLAGADVSAFVDSPVEVAQARKVRANPASYDDHFSQPRQFWLSLSAVEREHVVAAYTFELSKVYEQPIKERQLRALANIDPVLCQEVATGLGLPAPVATLTLQQPETSPVLSQVGGTWPADGRMIGIVVDVDDEASLEGLRTLRLAIDAAGMVPLVFAARGGEVGGQPVQRTFAAGRSVEVDALLLAGCPGPAPDALVARDVKAGGPGAPSLDPRVVLLLQECFRHQKAIGVWGAGPEALAAAGLAQDAPGVVVGDSPTGVLAEVSELLGSHRVWDRFAPSAVVA